ncbi:hypothetical protein AJ81_07920 [Pseudothermotoga hypogea DSM 11164 = NBRC 106472]|uniref:Uncharacterized protein n=1 Tax=Pseudothermotoga hypogea DSM 11164 = NBRC 106472 TaxID=1123384 RepID=A0A0X1KS82_9THEM|nr:MULTISPECIES: DUF5693 family protein [Pseudothermotoga]AJC74113.1 hypothetical protein AJ81_07920 [Pseudothermotoga hypogea DSM 11164 = NBRC 106472]MBC7122238.1 hypothetical protein [Pseudothermotoga sp.]MDI6863788.1 DUF5693 family protein [Pseudothermotoga sp.]
MKEPSRLKKVAEIAFFVSALVCLVIFVPSRFVADKRDLAYTLGISIDDDRIMLPSGKIVYVIDPAERIEPYMEYVTFRGDFSGYEAKTYADQADLYGVWIGMLEFNDSASFVKKIQLLRKQPERFFRIHTVRQEEVEKMRLTESMIYYRFRRAILERSIDMIWIQSLENVNVERILERIERQFGKPKAVPSPNIGSFKLQWLAFLSMVLLLFSQKPLLGIFTAPFWFWNQSIAVSVVSIIATVLLYSYREKHLLPVLYLILGLLTNAALWDFWHVNDLDVYRGVKLSLSLLPFFVLVKSVLREWKWLKKYWLAGVTVVAVAGFYYLSRSGNTAFVAYFERQFRDILEGLLWVRPRFKEIVGYPAFALWLSFPNFKWSFVLELLASVALVSTFNTFCHIKTPLMVSLYRSIFSIAVGYATLFVIRKVKQRAAQRL